MHITQLARRQASAIRLDEAGILSWLHFGDLHITEAHEQNYQDFVALVAHANHHLAGRVSFAVLPGDNVDSGSEDEYQLVKPIVDRLAIPLYAIPGDHDMKTGSLDLFRAYLEPEPVQSFVSGPYRCVFLNSLNSGDRKRFGFGQVQTVWLRSELEAATRQRQRAVLFMHTYPSELGGSAAEVTALVRQHRVLMVDMGHTHYNEIANDGQTIYATTRSTGQVEEGPVGFSVVNLDNGVVSWKFNPLGDAPLVMITSPADEAFIVDATRKDQLVAGTVDIRTKVFDHARVVAATCSIDDGLPLRMSPIGTGPVWHCPWETSMVADGVHHLTVQMETLDGRRGTDVIRVRTSQSGHFAPPLRKSGDDANAIGTWPEKGILGTQLGPNRNGRKWPPRGAPK